VRRAAAVAVAVVVGGVVAAAPIAGADVDPIRLTVTAPDAVKTGTSVPVSVAIATDAGALDPRDGTLHVGVRLAPECNGSFPSTPGPTAIDAAPAPQPVVGQAYTVTVTGSVKAGTSATYVACTYLYDDEGRQFATDTDTDVVVSPSGPANGGAGAGGGGTGGAGAGSGTCTPSVTPAARRVHRHRRLTVSYRACAKGTYRFTLLTGGARRTVTVRTAGRGTLHLATGAKAKLYTLVMVLPGAHGKHVHAAHHVRVIR
jgi:hypothetical protein